MRETADRMWTQIREYISQMPRGRKIQMAVLALVVIALSIVAVVLLSRTNWTVLPGTGDPTSTAHIHAALVDMGVPVKVEGNSILVPEERVGEIQMRLREQGLLGLADFDRSMYMPDASGFGVTDAHAKKQYDNQLGHDIRTQILQSPKIQNALVIVNSGETSPFRSQSNARAATASVMLVLSASTDMLSRQEANTLGDIVMASVPGIETDNISISDDKLNRYRLDGADLDIDIVVAQRIALQNRLVDQFQMSVEELLAPIYGMPNIQVQPNVVLNFDRRITEQVEFDPPIPGETEGITRSEEEILENSRKLYDAEGIPGTDENYMGTVEYPWGTLADGYEYARKATSRNMEINETRTMIEHEEGSIQSLSIAVNINSETEGITQDYTEEVTDLVSKAIGVSPNNISVKYLPFAHPDTTYQDMVTAMEEAEASARTQKLIEQIIMYAVILTLGIMVILFARTIFRTVKPPPEPEPVLVSAGPGLIDYTVGDDDELEEREYEDVDLQTKSAGLEQIERFIDRDAASVAQLLRNWLSED